MAKKKFDLSNLESKAENASKPASDNSDDIFNIVTGDDSLFNGIIQKDNLRPEKISVSKLDASKNNPYKVITDNEEFEALVASIDKEGIISPIIARPTDDGRYEVISGHRRLAAAKKLKLSKVPVVDKTLSDAEAAKLLVDANLNRETITISEKAKAIKLKYYAVQVLVKERLALKQDGDDTAALISKEMGMARTTVMRNLRLADLTDNMLSLVDNKTVNVKAGVELSYLDPVIQDSIFDVIVVEKAKVNEALAKKLKDTFRYKKDATYDEVSSILSGNTKKNTEPLISTTQLKRDYFPKGTTNAEVNSVIISLLKEWKEKNA